MIDRRGSADRRLARLTETNARLRRQLAEQESFWRIAHQDPLTELWNRRYADMRLGEELARAGTVAGYRFSVVVVDVDDLKRINDRDGHAAGDLALKWVAAFLTRVCGPTTSAAGSRRRVPADPSACGADECRRFVKRVRAKWQADARAEARFGSRTVGVSVGPASYPVHGTTVEALCAAADAAMYREKRRRTDPLRLLG